MRENHKWKTITPSLDQANYNTPIISIPPSDPFLANTISYLEENSQTFLGAVKEATSSLHYGKFTKSQNTHEHKDQDTRAKANTIKMGVELELEKYKYKPPEGYDEFIDHIRLFESKKKKDNSMG